MNDPKTTRIGNMLEGTVVRLHAVVLGQANNGQTRLWYPGVGESGVWSTTSSVLGQPVDDPALLAEAVRRLGRHTDG